MLYRRKRRDIINKTEARTEMQELRLLRVKYFLLNPLYILSCTINQSLNFNLLINE